MVSWSVYAAGLLTRTAATSSAHIHLVSDAGSTAGACIAAGRPVGQGSGEAAGLQPAAAVAGVLWAVCEAW